MSIPKEKLIIQEIKEIIKETDEYCKEFISAVHTSPIKANAYLKIAKVIDSYVDPGYIGGPVVGEEVKEEEG